MRNPYAVALDRRAHKQQLQASYAGAQHTRLLRDWTFGAATLSPDMEARGQLAEMRGRARELVRNNPYIAGYAQAVEDNLIGPDGIQLRARITTAAGKPNKRTNWSIESAWLEWGCPENASLDGHDSWNDIERMVARALGVDGEYFILPKKGADNSFGFAVQMVDPDLLDENYDVAPDENGVEIRMGVEVNKVGKPLAYHFFRAHPSELSRRGLSRDRIRVPAEEVIHDFIRYRPGQTRGVTPLAPVLTSAKMLDGYEEAELVAARYAASKMGFILNTTDQAIENIGEPKTGDRPKRTINVTPGSIDELGPGQTFETFDPTHPSDAFKDFTSTILRGIARGLGISYLTLTGDLTAANYSSMRAGLLPEREHWRMLQRRLAMHLHRRVYRAWLPQALMTPHLRVDSRLASDYYAIAWDPRGWKWVDPQNDLAALEAEIKLGINSRQRACAERGVDFEEIIDELVDEEDYAEEVGIDISGMKSVAPPAPAQKALPPGKDDTEASAPALPLALVVT